MSLQYLPFLILSMIFMHILDDFHLQGILANMKQQSWWQKNYPKPLYSKDYVVALVLHSFSWVFMIMLPIAIIRHFDIGGSFLFLFLVNAIIHGVIDDLKCNKLKINLIADQTLHMFQIIWILTWYVRNMI